MLWACFSYVSDPDMSHQIFICLSYKYLLHTSAKNLVFVYCEVLCFLESSPQKHVGNNARERNFFARCDAVPD